MKERFEIYDGSAEAKKAKGKSKNLSGFHPAVYRICAQKHRAGWLKDLAAAGVRCGRGGRCCNGCRSGIGTFGASDRRSDLLWLPG